MKLLSVSGPLHKEFGGPPMAVTGICTSLAKLGHQISVLVCGQSVQDYQSNSVFFNKLISSGVQTKVIHRKNVNKYGALLRLHEIKSIWNMISEADVIVLHQIYELQFIGIYPILILLKKPYVVMPHGTLTTYQRKQHKIRKALFYPLTYLLLRSSNGIFVATEFEKRQLPSFLENKGSIVGLGIETQNPKIRNSINYSQNFNLLFMGRITKKKRLDIALQAFALASKKSELKMKFIVCGSGEETEVAQIKQLVRDLQIENDVEFCGWVDSYEKERTFLQSDCFILTSEDENFAIAAAEALAYGVPCILSSNVALASLVRKYGAGVVFAELLPNIVATSITNLAGQDKVVVMNSALSAASELSWQSIALKWEESIVRILRN